jgi:small-conductance mechanosensitive channel
MTHVYIQIKFAHRHDSPGCLEVKNETVDIHKNLVVFTAYCVLGDIPIKFELPLDLFTNVNKEESNWFFSSVGRYQLNLKKEQPQMYWDRLLRTGVEAPPNMKVWWEMRAKYEDEIKKYIDEDDDNEFAQQIKDMEQEVKGKRRKKNEL